MKRAELIASLVAAGIGLPLVSTFAGAIIEGETRRHEAPLRAMLGDDAYETIAAGHSSDQGYFGDDRTAPDFTLPGKDGKPWHLKDYRGKVVVINFWTLTCQPCIEEMPSLDELAGILQKEKDVELVAVSGDSSFDAVAKFFPKGSKLKVLLDADRSVIRGKFGTRLYPETWIIDREGVIRARIDGARDWSSPIALDLIKSFL